MPPQPGLQQIGFIPPVIAAPGPVKAKQGVQPVFPPLHLPNPVCTCCPNPIVQEWSVPLVVDVLPPPVPAPVPVPVPVPAPAPAPAPVPVRASKAAKAKAAGLFIFEADAL